MKVDLHRACCIVTREPGDPKIYTDSALMYRIKLTLQAQGHDVIKKLMWKDGCLVSDTQHYVRSRKCRAGATSFCIWDGAYALRFAYQAYNKGMVHLDVLRNLWGEDGKS